MEAGPGLGFVSKGVPFRGRLAEGVYRQLTQDIEAATLQPGSIISERDFVRRFQISRTPIREALQRLLSEGYLRQLDRGYEVVELTDQEIANAYAVRGMLEGMAARQAAGARRRVSVAKLWEAHERESEALSDARPAAEVGRVIEDFHVVLAEVSANSFLQSVLTAARWRTEPYTRRRWNIPGTAAQDVEEHRQLILAVEAGEPMLAELTARMLTRRSIRELTGRELAGDVEMAEILGLVQIRAAGKSH